MTEQSLTLTNRRLLEVANGYRALMHECIGVSPEGAPVIVPRKFPSPMSRQRVTFHFDSLAPALKAYDEGLKDLAEREKEILAMVDGPERKAAHAALRVEFEAYQDATVEIPTPRKLLVEADLPKGEKGTDSNAEVVLKLRPEFFVLTDPDAPPANE